MYRIKLNRMTTDIADKLFCFATALVLNINGIRVMQGMKNIAYVNIIYVIFFACGAFYWNKKHARVIISPKLTIALVVFVVGALISMLLCGVSEVARLMKFIVGLLIAYMIVGMDRTSILRAMRYTVWVSVSYAIYTIYFYNMIYTTLLRAGRANYLEITLPIGLSLTISVVCIVFAEKKHKVILENVIACIILLGSLSLYSARGNLIFPFLVGIIALVYRGMSNIRVFLRNVLILLIGSYFVYLFMSYYANEYLLKRLMSLFESIGDEPRVELYNYYITYIMQNLRWFTGTGFSTSAGIIHQGGISSNYPHNFILELVGEMGILGALVVIISMDELAKSELKFMRKLRLDKNNRENLFLFGVVNAGLCFYLFTYFKSYSIYDGYQFFIFIALALNLNYSVRNNIGESVLADVRVKITRG